MKKLSRMGVVLPMLLALGAGVYVCLGVASLFVAPYDVGASSPPDGTVSKRYLGQGDWVWNWDFEDEALNVDRVDWGMRFIIYNNADVDEVKDRLDGVEIDPRITPFLNQRIANLQFARMDDHPTQSVWEWDGDRGIKDHPGCSWNWTHMRIYATSSGDRNFNTTYGYYVVATVHRDHENPYNCEKVFISYESDEDRIIDRIEDHLGSDTEYDWTVYDRAYFWDNDVTGYVPIGSDNPSSHWYQSDGWGVNVHLPSDD